MDRPSSDRSDRSTRKGSTGSELIVQNSPVRLVQLEHNVHESSDLLNSDSLDDRADESKERAILRHSRHQSRLSVILSPVILVIPAPVIPAPVTPGQPVTPVNTGQIVSIQSTEHIRLGLMLLITGQLY